jgi:hypothetical protein
MMGMRCGRVALATWLFASLARAEDAGLTIETGSPDALCPELASTRAAVSRRLGVLTLPEGSSGYRARYTIGHAPVGSPRDFVRLELFGPEGALQLSRDLPLAESCSTMAEVIALVLDRYFRALLDDEPEEPEEGSTEDARLQENAPAVATGALPPPSAPSSPSPAPVGPADVPPVTISGTRPIRLALVAFELAFRNAMEPALGVRTMIEPWSSIYVGTALQVGLLSEGENLAAGGRASSRDATWRGYAAWGAQFGPVRTYAGPGIRLGVSRGTGLDLTRSKVGYRAMTGAGLDAGAIWVTDEGWSFAVSAALDVWFPELSGRFYIDQQEVLELEMVRGWMGMAVGYDF